MSYDDIPYEYESKKKIQERLDQISMFLAFTEPSNLKEMTVSKEFSVSHIRLEHMDGHIQIKYLFNNLLDSGQIKQAMKIGYMHNAEFRTLMSVDGEFMNNVTKQELTYKQYQHLIPHKTEEKRGLFGRKKKGGTEYVVRD